MKKRKRLVYQKGRYDCGFACLKMILQNWIPQEDISIEAHMEHVNLSGGLSAKELIEIVRHYGFEAKGAKIALENLEQFSGSAILFLKSNHYVVYERKIDNKIYYLDPAFGKASNDLNEFKKIYSGISILITNTDNRKNTLNKYLKNILIGLKDKNYIYKICLVIILGIINNIEILGKQYYQEQVLIILLLFILMSCLCNRRKNKISTIPIAYFIFEDLNKSKKILNIIQYISNYATDIILILFCFYPNIYMLIVLGISILTIIDYRISYYSKSKNKKEAVAIIYMSILILLCLILCNKSLINSWLKLILTISCLSCILVQQIKIHLKKWCYEIIYRYKENISDK